MKLEVREVRVKEEAVRREKEKNEEEHKKRYDHLKSLVEEYKKQMSEYVQIT